MSKWKCTIAVEIGYREKRMKNFTLIVLITKNVLLRLGWYFEGHLGGVRWDQAVMSAGRVGSRFEDGSDSTGRSCRSTVTRPISDRSSYSEVVTQPIFRSIGLQRPSDPTDWGSGLNRLNRFDIRFDIVTTNQWFWSGFITVVGDNVTGMLITARFLINCPLHRIM